jgi:hypothetical protein
MSAGLKRTLFDFAFAGRPASEMTASSKTRINSFPMIFRFRSGSVTPFSFDKKRTLASTYFSLMWKLSRKTRCTVSASLARSTPLFHKDAGELIAYGFVQERGSHA